MRFCGHLRRDFNREAKSVAVGGIGPFALLPTFPLGVYPRPQIAPRPLRWRP